MVLDTPLLNTQYYKVGVKGKVEQPMERSSTLPYTFVSYLFKREASGHPRLRSPTLFTYSIIIIIFIIIIIVVIVVVVTVNISLIILIVAIGPSDQGSIPSRVIPKTQKCYLMSPCTQYYKVRIKVKMEQSREWSSALPYTFVL